MAHNCGAKAIAAIADPDYVLELERVGADAEPTDPHGTLNLLGLSKDGLRQYEDVSGLSVWSGVSRYGAACLARLKGDRVDVYVYVRVPDFPARRKASRAPHH